MENLVFSFYMPNNPGVKVYGYRYYLNFIITNYFWRDVFFFTALFFVLLGFSFFVTFNSLDTDFGWHLRTGQLILERGVPYVDWYSYTMPLFPWIDHEWLLDVLIFKLYPALGFHSLLLIFLFLYTISFFVIKKRSHSFKVACIPIILGYLATIGGLGLRPQLLTILFIAILTKLLEQFLENSSKVIYFVPLLLMRWDNMHAGFFAGIFILCIILFLEVIKKSKIIQKINHLRILNLKEQSSSKILKLIAVLILSFLATLVNPYGFRIYEEIFSVMGDAFLKSNITEWMPLVLHTLNATAYIYIGIFTVLMGRYFKKISINNLVISLVFLFFALSSGRHFLVFVILATPVFSDMVMYLGKEYDWEKIISLLPRHQKLIFIGLLSVLIIFLGFNLYYFLYGSSRQVGDYYPIKALSFLETLPLSENAFNSYNWGGYLIWKVPERKLFIDGRMPSWRQNGQFVFGDYIKVMEADDGFEEIIRKYDIKLFILPRGYVKQEQKEQIKKEYNKFVNITSNNKYLVSLFCTILSCPKKDIYEELHKLGWKEVYQDETTVVLKK